MILQRIILIRVAQAFCVFLALSILLFFTIEILPGDIVSATSSRFTPLDQIEYAREQLGLTEHPVKRYIHWIGSAAVGDFGSSPYTRGNIAPVLFERLGNTALLTLLSSMIALPIGFTAAVISVMTRGSIFDRTSTMISLIAISLPEFLIAYLLMTIFVVTYPLFPAHTIFYDEMDIGARLHAMILPASTLAIVGIAPVLRISRASLINVLSANYIEMARLKGVPIWRIVTVHALPNAIPPIINMVVLLIAHFMVGAFIVEQIFSYPGIGNMMIAAVKFRDIPLVLAVGMVFAVFFISLNLLADIISLLATPRARLPFSK